MRKLTLLAGLAAGYVLGTRDGRQRYEQIKDRAQRLWNDPTVRDKAKATGDFVAEKAPEVKEKVADAAGKATSKSRDTDTDTDSAGGTPTHTGTSTDTTTVPGARPAPGSTV